MWYNRLMNRDLVKILGFNVDTFSFDEAVEYSFNHHGQVVTINPEMISAAHSNSEFANIIDNADLIVPDGIGVELGLKILGHNVRRIAGIELGKELIIKFSKAGKKIAMVGAKPTIVDGAIENLKNEIAKTQPDLVLVALGSPKQEFFIHSLKDRLPNATMIGLGGSFDVWAGVVERAPEIYQKLGLEWLYRTIKEPQRFKRIFPTLPLFVLKVFKERLNLK